MIKKFLYIISLWSTLLLSDYCHTSQPKKDSGVNDDCDLRGTLKKQAENGIPIRCSFSWIFGGPEVSFIKFLRKKLKSNTKDFPMVHSKKKDSGIPNHVYWGYNINQGVEFLKQGIIHTASNNQYLLKALFHGLFADHYVGNCYAALIQSPEEVLTEPIKKAIDTLKPGSFTVLCADPKNTRIGDIRSIEPNVVVQSAGSPFVLNGNSYMPQNGLKEMAKMAVQGETIDEMFAGAAIIRKYFNTPQYLFYYFGEKLQLTPTFDPQAKKMPHLKWEKNFKVEKNELQNMWRDGIVCADYDVPQIYGTLVNEKPLMHTNKSGRSYVDYNELQRVVLKFADDKTINWEETPKGTIARCSAIDLRVWYNSNPGKILRDDSPIADVCHQILKSQYIGTASVGALAYGLRNNVEFKEKLRYGKNPNDFYQLGILTNDLREYGQHSKKGSVPTKRQKIYLTLLGGGSFANSLSIIAKSICTDELKKLIKMYHLDVVVMYRPRVNDRLGLHTFETNKAFLESMQDFANKVNTETGATVQEFIIIPKDYNNIEKYLRNFYPLQTAKKTSPMQPTNAVNLSASLFNPLLSSALLFGGAGLFAWLYKYKDMDIAKWPAFASSLLGLFLLGQKIKGGR